MCRPCLASGSALTFTMMRTLSPSCRSVASPPIAPHCASERRHRFSRVRVFTELVSPAGPDMRAVRKECRWQTETKAGDGFCRSSRKLLAGRWGRFWFWESERRRDRTHFCVHRRKVETSLCLTRYTVQPDARDFDIDGQRFMMGIAVRAITERQSRRLSTPAQQMSSRSKLKKPLVG